MHCPKHPYQEMTLLFQFYVCDTCQPPKTLAASLKPKATTSCPSIDLNNCSIPSSSVPRGRWGADGIFRDREGYIICSCWQRCCRFRHSSSSMFNMTGANTTGKVECGPCGKVFDVTIEPFDRIESSQIMNHPDSEWTGHSWKFLP